MRNGYFILYVLKNHPWIHIFVGCRGLQLQNICDRLLFRSSWTYLEILIDNFSHNMLGQFASDLLMIPLVLHLFHLNVLNKFYVPYCLHFRSFRKNISWHSLSYDLWLCSKRIALQRKFSLELFYFFLYTLILMVVSAVISDSVFEPVLCLLCSYIRLLFSSEYFKITISFQLV